MLKYSKVCQKANISYRGREERGDPQVLWNSNSRNQAVLATKVQNDKIQEKHDAVLN